MELLGAVASGVTLAALFKYAFEALDLIHLYQTQDVDFNKLQLQFRLEKCRLYNWGMEMGLANNSRPNLLNNWHHKDLVTDCLRHIVRLLSDAESIHDKYGCVEVTPSTELLIERGPQYSRSIAAVFDNFKIQSSRFEKSRATVHRKSRWIVRDRKKFILLIEEVRSLIDSLQNITNELSSTARLEEALRSRIGGIPDVETLLMIASVWKESHPRIASTASTRAESLSMSSGKKRDISEWRSFIGTEDSDETLVGNLEDLTITELKHSVVQSREEIATLKRMIDEGAKSITVLERRMATLITETEEQSLSIGENLGETRMLKSVTLMMLVLLFGKTAVLLFRSDLGMVSVWGLFNASSFSLMVFAVVWLSAYSFASRWKSGGGRVLGLGTC
ncbi:prion-inhibition and propagation-domain-containing protein [Ilyonectria sp. MPI-CAGE-AT-0026]|nr:prion-inhibition and propagation-domain-containing protein [Ilyonectria sp. MPI-CAGE-AT-0026]